MVVAQGRYDPCPSPNDHPLRGGRRGDNNREGRTDSTWGMGLIGFPTSHGGYVPYPTSQSDKNQPPPKLSLQGFRISI